MIETEELTPKNLAEAINIVCDEFPPADEPERADMEMSASLDPTSYKDYLNKTGILSPKYWLAEKDGVPFGVTGLYNYVGDEDNVIWLGWFVVVPSFRHKSIGTELLRFTAEQARLLGKKFLRVYNVPEPDRDTRAFFEKNGFVLLGQKPWDGYGNFTEYHYQFNLVA